MIAPGHPGISPTRDAHSDYQVNATSDPILPQTDPGIVKSLTGLLGAVLSQVPTAPDGLKVAERLALNEQIAQQPTSLVRDVVNQIVSGRSLGDMGVLIQALTTAGKPVNDRELLMERLIQRLTQMDATSPIRAAVSDAFINLLWKDLPHPATSMLGEKYKFRQADGSYNNLYEPNLGAAGQPYGRTVNSVHPLPPNLPDPEVIFDCLLKRKPGTFTPHPSGISSMMFGFAVTIVHTIFRTRRTTDPSADSYERREAATINDASSYLDLSILYGNNQTEQDRVRDKSQGLGLLYPDVVAERVLFLMPPHVTAFAVLLNRNHNYIAEMLYKINEKNLFKPPGELSADILAKQDEEIFQTARLINCGHYVNIILHDYVASILGTNRTQTDWFLDPAKDIKDLIAGNGGAERGTGNVASIEFGILYRWHSSMSQADEKWFTTLMCEKTGKRVDDISTQDYFKAAGSSFAKLGEDPRSWHIPGLSRLEDGRFADDDLARILQDAIEEPAGAFQANGIPAIMRAIDSVGMTHAREVYGLCTLNEFREHFGLAPYRTFEEWNSNKDVAALAEKLYIHPNNIELYVGLMAEEAKPGNMVGSGLAINHTISRAILSDAVALVRGDRYFTTGFNAGNLTKWGMQYCSPDFQAGSQGGMLGKLILRNLPRHFDFNSVYALFPFQTPTSIRRILAAQGLDGKYNFDRPNRQPDWRVLRSKEAIDGALRDHQTFGVIYTNAIENLTRSRYGFVLGFDSAKHHDGDLLIMNDAVFPPGWQAATRQFYDNLLPKLITSSSYVIPGTDKRICDFVRDVSNLAPVYWIANQFGVPLKTAESPLGLVTPQELFLALFATFAYIFMNFDAVESFKLGQGALHASELIKTIVEARILQHKGILGRVEGLLKNMPGLMKPSDDASAFYRRLIASNRDMDFMVSSTVAVMTASCMNQAQAFAQMFNGLLEDQHTAALQQLIDLAEDEGTESERIFLKTCWEAQRLDPQVPAIPRFVRKDVHIPDGLEHPTAINKGERVWLDVHSLCMDPIAFPDPETIKTDRPMQDYRMFGHAMHTCLGAKLVAVTLPRLMRHAVKLRNLQRAPGKQGQLIRFKDTLHGIWVWKYVTQQSSILPFATSMSIQYEI